MPAGSDTFVPPVAPFRVPRKKSAGRSTSGGGGDTSNALEAATNGEAARCPVPNFIRPDLPSRCTWQPNKDWKDAPHTRDAP